jgi:hypothetical protein
LWYQQKDREQTHLICHFLQSIRKRLSMTTVDEYCGIFHTETISRIVQTEKECGHGMKGCRSMKISILCSAPLPRVPTPLMITAAILCCSLHSSFMEFRPEDAENARLQRSLLEMHNENAARLREIIELQQRMNDLRQEAVRSHADADNANRELLEARRQLEEMARQLHTAERENAKLKEELDPLRREQSRWCRPLLTALRTPISTDSSAAPDFRHCVSQWNGVLELTAKGDYFSDAIPLTCDDHWELRGWFQFTGRPDMVHYLGLDCYTDTDGHPGNRVTIHSVNRVAGTEAILVEGCQRGDRILRVRGNTVAD